MSRTARRITLTRLCVLEKMFSIADANQKHGDFRRRRAPVRGRPDDFHGEPAPVHDRPADFCGELDKVREKLADFHDRPAVFRDGLDPVGDGLDDFRDGLAPVRDGLGLVGSGLARFAMIFGHGCLVSGQNEALVLADGHRAVLLRRREDAGARLN